MGFSSDFGENAQLYGIVAPGAFVAIETGKLKAIEPTLRNLEHLAKFQTLPLRAIMRWLSRFKLSRHE